MAETILIVDDEESVRATMHQLLADANLGCDIRTAADAKEALEIANQRMVDLAVLDWNLGEGSNGLQLLRDLYVFNPNIVAIMVTGFANLVTPVEAMRMGVRDYIEKKNRDIERFLVPAVKKQLEKLRPEKRQREVHRQLLQFRDAVKRILPLVQATAAINDPVPFTEAVRSLLRFLLQSTGASDGAVVVWTRDGDTGSDGVCKAYGLDGQALAVELVPFSSSIASAVATSGEASLVADLQRRTDVRGVELQPFERGHSFLLAARLFSEDSATVVLELFDKRSHPASRDIQPFTEQDRHLLASTAGFASELFKHALAERDVHHVLLEALDAALRASGKVTDALTSPPSGQSADSTLPGEMLHKLRDALKDKKVGIELLPEQALQLAQLLRVIAFRHGAEATQFCIQVMTGLDDLLRKLSGEPGTKP